MSDLIDRKAAIDVIDKIFPADPMHNEYTQGITCGAALAMEFIKQLPSADPKNGRWTDEGWYADGHDHHAFHCSVCGKHLLELADEIKNYNYCPHCGAKMEVEER